MARNRINAGKMLLGGVAAGLVLAAASYVSDQFIMATMAGIFFSRDLYIRSEAVTLVAMLAAGLAGGWVYGEEERDN